MERIKQMESYFDILKEAVSADKDAIEKDDTLKEYFQKLLQYYESAEWRHDYELDEKGLLPPDLKRGILSAEKSAAEKPRRHFGGYVYLTMEE